MNWFRRSLASKLILAFLVIAITVGGLVTFFVRQSNTTAFRQLLQDRGLAAAQTIFAEYYATNGNWRGVESLLPNTPRLAPPLPAAAPPTRGQTPRPTLQPDPFPPDPFPNDERSQIDIGRVEFGLIGANGRVVIPLAPDFRRGENVPPEQFEQDSLPITVGGEVDGEIVGYLVTRPDRDRNQQPAPVLTAEEQIYLARTNAAVVQATLIALLIALALGIGLTRYLLRPIRDLTEAADSMASGDLNQQVVVRSSDELGALAQAFNHMSADLAQANQLRRQMTADIAHDLRTPLQIISGYVESMRDGVLSPTPARMSTIYTEIEHLEHLIADLRTLSRADAGELSLNRQRLNVDDLLERVLQRYRLAAEKGGVTLGKQAGESGLSIFADEERMIQVLGNLVNNALRYTPAGERITLGARAEEKANRAGVTLWVRDTGSGIAPEDLPHLFERFYRADKARSTDTGESGLGLAIAKALVEAHGGAIRAESQGSGSGATFAIWLP